MPSDHTSKYQFNLWEKSDKVLMEDFNDDNRKTEDALIALDASKVDYPELEELAGELASTRETIPKFDVGTYTGAGEYGSSHPCKLTFSIVPKLVVIGGDQATFVLLPGQTKGVAVVNNAICCMSVKWSGTTLSWYLVNAAIGDCDMYPTATYQMNKKSSTYHYLAIG